MTANFPYSEATNFRTMFDIRDLRGPLPEKSICPHSITAKMQNSPEMNKASYILKLSGLQDLYQDPQANFTLFVPSNDALDKLPHGVLENMDRSTARAIIQSSTLKRKITMDLLKGTPAAYYNTMSAANRLYITNISGETFISECVKVAKGNISASNGIIHIVDGLIWPNMV